MRYREGVRGTRASSKPNRRLVESQEDPMARSLLVTWALAGSGCCCASWVVAWRGGTAARGTQTMAASVERVREDSSLVV